jgi:hypothetical protein
MFLILPLQLFAQVSFDKVEIRTAFAKAKEGDEGRLLVDGNKIVFASNKGLEYFSIPTKAVTELFYSRVSGRRIGAAVIVTPLLLFSKGRKHYMTITFDDQAGMIGAVEFKLHKSNYRPVLRAVEQAAHVTMVYDQEGVKETEQKPGERQQKKPQPPPS